ncbi:hypothetical protein MHJ97_07035 [Macrococcus epidermidis]|uniref:hypothetical protein n=1 Tax=Macrococcus epidermidis TaxID=1902580 RepID=UPI001EF2383A|nr:hypothetical protein [Macrococcus epidermidis]MCG7420193.1 hypothetical protein [Macrococcus epidermidis]
MSNNRNDNNRKNQDRDVIYNSETDRNKTRVTHQADGDTYKDGRKVREGEHHDKVVVEEHDRVRHDHIEREPKKKSPWAWLIPLLLLLIAIPLLMNLCNNDNDDKDKTDTETTTEEKATTEEETTEEVETTEDATTEEASIKKFDLATITNFDLAA